MKNEAIIIAIYNNKGGVGKTTFCMNLIHSIVADFSRKDGQPYRCLAVDNDGQGNLSQILTGMTEDEISETYKNTIFDLYVDEDVEAKECIVPTRFANIDAILATDDHNDTPDAIASYMDNSRILREKLQSIKYQYSIIFLDCSPTRDRNVYNAMFAADVVISPVETQLFSQTGLKNLLGQINRVNKKREIPLLHYVFLSKIDNRQKHNNEKVRSNLRNVLLDSFLEEKVSLWGLYAKSFEEGYTAINHPSDNRGREEMRKITDRILSKIEEEVI